MLANVYIPHMYGGVPNYIVGVDPETCVGREVYPVFGVAKTVPRDSNRVMNGIGTIEEDLLITGKMWTKMFRVRRSGVRDSPEWAQWNITKFVESKLNFR